MHYAIFSALYPPHLGGVEFFTQSLARHLVARGDEVLVVTSALTPDAPVHETDEAGVRILRLPSIAAMGGRLPIVSPGHEVVELMVDVAEFHPRRVLVNTRFYPLSLLGAGWGSREGLNTIVLDHGSAYLTLGNPVADAVLQGYEQGVTRHLEGECLRFAGISAKSAQWLGEFGIACDLVIPNAIDAAAFCAERTTRNFHAELGISKHAPLVAFAGRLTAAKGAGIVVEAARMLPRVTFALAGTGDLEETIRAEAPRNLVCLGPLAHGDLSALLAESTALALPSESEGFATALLEAGAWGVPPVTTDVGGAREVLADPSWGVILDRRTPLALAMGVSEVLSWPEGLREERSRALAAHVEAACTWDATLAALDGAFARGEG